MDKLLNLSFELQIILVGGYLGFWISSTGLSQRLKPMDMLMQILVYGIFAKIVLVLMQKYEFDGAILPLALAVAASVFMAMCWRGFARKMVAGVMNKTKVHMHDNNPSVLASMLEEKGAVWEFVQIHLNDGKIYESAFGLLCDDLPLNAIMIDDDGNVALYVTKIYPKDRSAAPTEFDFDKNNPVGTITYIPVDRIDRIDVNWG